MSRVPVAHPLEVRLWREEGEEPALLQTTAATAMSVRSSGLCKRAMPMLIGANISVQIAEVEAACVSGSLPSRRR